MNNTEITINFTRIFNILVRNFWVIVIPSVIISLAVGFTGKFLIHKKYDATVTILPPRGSQLSIPFGSVLKNFLPGEMNIGSTGIKEVLALLESRRMAEDVIYKFNLMDYFKTKKLDKAIKYLGRMTKIEVDDNTGVIIIRVRTKSPQMSADIANFYVENLEKLNDLLKISVTKPFVKVLDPARPPDVKAWPKNALNTIITFIIMIFFLSSFIIYKEYTNPFVREPEAFEESFEVLGLIPGEINTEPIKNRILSFMEQPTAFFPVIDEQSRIDEIFHSIQSDGFILLQSPFQNPVSRENLKEFKSFVVLAEFNVSPTGALMELKELMPTDTKPGLIIYNIRKKFISKKYRYIFPELRSGKYE